MLFIGLIRLVVRDVDCGGIVCLRHKRLCSLLWPAPFPLLRHHVSHVASSWDVGSSPNSVRQGMLACAPAHVVWARARTVEGMTVVAPELVEEGASRHILVEVLVAVDAPVLPVHELKVRQVLRCDVQVLVGRVEDEDHVAVQGALERSAENLVFLCAGGCP